MILHVFLLAVLITTAGVAAEDTPLIVSDTPLSLDSLVSIGLANNPEHRQVNLDTRLNCIGNLSAIGRFLPTTSVGLNFSENHFRESTYFNPDGTPATSEQYIESESRSSSQYLSLNESLFEGGQRFMLYRIAKQQAKINNLSVENSRKSLTAGIAQQVTFVLTQEKLYQLSKRLRDQRQDAYDLAKARYDVGAVTELDVLQAEIELGAAENDIISNERYLQANREALNQLLGIDLKSRFPVMEDPEVAPFSFDLDELVREAYLSRTDLQIVDLGVKQWNNYIWYEKGRYLPSLSLGVTWTRDESGTTDEDWTLDPRDRNTRYSMNLSWTLFDGFGREYDVVNRRVQRDRAMEEARMLRLNLEKEVRDAYYDLETIYNQLRVTERNRDLAERTLNLERERYRLGATSQLSLRDAQITYEQAETDNISKQLEYQTSLIALELAVGISLR